MAMPAVILRRRHLLALLVLLCGLCSASSGGMKSMESVPDLQQLMYTMIDGYPCVRLLSLSGEIGCATNINATSIAVAASLVARTLFILATNDSNLGSSALSAISANISLVEELMGCLLTCDPGLSCQLVQNYIVPRTVCPRNYVGVMLGAPSSNPDPSYVDDTSRFVWNFLADKTSASGKNRISACANNCSKDEVCIKSETNPSGTCVLSTTRYVPAYSRRLTIKNGFWKLLPENSSDPMGMVDLVWTESNWDTVGLRVYTVQDSAYDHFILLGGLAITLLAYLMIVTSRAFIEKALKRD